MTSDEEAERARLENALAGRAPPTLGLQATAGRLAELTLKRGLPGDAARALGLVRGAASQVGVDDPLYPKLRHVEAQALRRAASPEVVASAAEVERDAWQRSLVLAPREAIGFAAEWGDWAWLEERWAEAAEAYACAHQALRRFILRQVGDERERLVQSQSRYASRGAYAYAKLDDARDAIVLLERANDLVFNLHQQRWAKRKLGEAHPEICSRLDAAIAAKAAFEASARRGFGLDSLGDLPQGARDAQAALDAMVAEIRAIDGFSSFALPSQWSDVEDAASFAPLVYLIATDKGSASLVVKRQEGPLSTVLIGMVSETEQDILDAARKFLAREFGTDRADRKAALFDLLGWLGLHIMSAVRTALDQVGQADKPVVLVPFGLLGYLPLHASLAEMTDPPRLHYFFHPRDVSFGYSARGLVKSHGTPRAWADGGSLVIDNPRPLPPLYDPLTLSGFEAAEVTRHVPGVVLSGKAATTQAVCAALPSAVLVHFSCHGDADSRIAYSGALLLADGKVLTFEQLRQMTEISARLVVLSACRSGSAALGVEHMVSLPAAFLAAGAEAVLGTFWHTDEMASVLLFGRFYALCIGDGLPPTAALGEAQAWLMTSAASALRKAAPAAALALPAAGELLEAGEDERPYSHPWYWAAFFLAGA